MEKNGSNTKATVTGQAMTTFKGVEHGCGMSAYFVKRSKEFNVWTEHIQQFMSRPMDVIEKLTNSYTELQKLVARPLQAQTTKDPKDPKKVSFISLRPTYLCLQCSNVSSLEERDNHSESRGHVFCK